MEARRDRLISSCVGTALLIAAIFNQLAVARNKTLYVISFLPYPNNNSDLKPFTDHGPLVVHGARLALEKINNRTDILWPDYELKILEVNDGCNVSFIGVINLLSQLFYATDDKRIVGIIGPECAAAVQAVSQLTGKPDISLINVHYANSPTLSNHASFPYAFGILRTTEIDVNAVVALFKYNKWTRAAVLYDFRVLVYATYKLFAGKIKGVADVAFAAAATTDHIPLQEVRDSYARVIVSFLRTEILYRTLCLAYHRNMIYPEYQWILVQVYYYNDFSPISFLYNGVQYKCSAGDIASVLNRRLTTWSSTTDPSLQMNLPFPDGCKRDYFCFATYDALWALALALNSSVEPLKARGLSLDGSRRYGNDITTRVVQEQMLKLKFQGLTGKIRFNQTTGFVAVETSSIYQFFNETQKDEEIALFTFANGTIEVNNSMASFVSTDFDTSLVSFPLYLMVLLVLLNAAACAIIGIIQVINGACSATKSIKASSAVLNNFAYLGCYLVSSATALFAILESNVSSGAQTALCGVVPSVLAVGLTLTLSTVTVKTARVYCIFAASASRVGSSRVLKDANMSVLIVALTLPSILFCSLWLVYDRPVRLEERKLIQNEGSLIVQIKQSCYCQYYATWLAIIALFDSGLLVASVVLAFLTRKVITIKEFQNYSVIVLAYLLSITWGIGVIVYLIMSVSGPDYTIHFIFLILTATVYLVLLFLFLPPVVPVFRKICCKAAG